jgi:hypothetical protein
VLLPLFRQFGYHWITAPGHKDKALECGTDVWMRYTLPTQRVLYFGIHAKKGKLDASGVTKAGNEHGCCCRSGGSNWVRRLLRVPGCSAGPWFVSQRIDETDPRELPHLVLRRPVPAAVFQLDSRRRWWRRWRRSRRRRRRCRLVCHQVSFCSRCSVD